MTASRGWLFYDGDCSLCAGAALRFKSFLNRRGFEILPLQTPQARAWLGLKPGELPDEMKLLTDAGQIFGGADAAMEIARRTWWTWPLFALAQFPGAMSLARLVYRRIAANRHCLNGTCRIQEKGKNMSQRIILAGGGGFLGGALAKRFIASGCEVIVLTRSPKIRADGAREFFWDTKTLGEWAKFVDGADAVINLTGKSVDCRYNEKNRREIIASRVDSTRAVGEAIAQAKSPPRVWLNASSATIYKHTFDQPHDENGETGATPEARDEFSIEVIRQWERALDEAPTPRTRKVALRIALVFGRNGGAFPVFRRLAKSGLGGAMGDGRQFFSWMHEEDFVRAVEWIIAHENLNGAINLTAPDPLPNREVMRRLRRACGMPVGLPAKEWMLEIGAFFLRTETELLVKSRYVVPGKLLASGFQFKFPQLQDALADLCR